MDRQVLLAIALSAILVLAYQEYLRIYYPELGKKPPHTAEPTPALVATPGGALPQAPTQEIGPLPKADVTIDTPLVHVALSSLGGRLASYQLKHYRTAMDPQSPPLEWIHRPTEPPPGSEPAAVEVTARCTFTPRHGGSPGRVHGSVLHGARHGTSRVLAVRNWNDACAADQTQRRLDADNSIGRRRTNHRPISLRSDCRGAEIDKLLVEHPR